MKLRIQDNSVRFRITVKELETLVREGELIRSTVFPNGGGALQYGLRVNPGISSSSISCRDSAIMALLSYADLATLQDPTKEGVYITSEEHGARFIFFIEKDRPSTACDKPEHWIYEDAGGKPTSFRPIQKP